jgi:diguanylate cyclase (GGDEF)-like protein/PAS domain S-box-containing protein
MIDSQIHNMASPTALLGSEERFRTIADTSYDWETWILPNGTYEYVSPACKRITGYSQEEFRNNQDLFLDIVHPEDRALLDTHHCKHLDQHEFKSELEFRIINKAGEVRWIWHQCQSVFSSDGDWLGRRGTSRDVTLIKQVERKLRQEQQLFNAGPTVVFKWKAVEDWPVEYVSANVQYVFGYVPADLLSSRVAYRDIIHPDDLQRVTSEVNTYNLAGKDQFIQEYRVIGGDGIVRWVLDKTNVLRDDHGRITHYHGYLLDISQQKEAENALRLSESQLEKAQHIARLGYWQWDRQSDLLVFSESVYATLGLDSVIFKPSRRNILRLVHPEDRRRVTTLFTNMEGKRGSESIEFQIHGAKQLIVMRVEYEFNLDDAGNVVGMQGICQDITSFKKTETQLALFDKIFANTIEGIVITDSEGIIQDMNPAGQRITSYNLPEVIGKSTSVFKSDRHPPEFHEKMWATLLTKGFWQGEIWSRRKNGEVYPLQMSLTALNGETNLISSVIYVFHDMTEIKIQEKEIHFQTYHDALTGLPNRILLLDRLKVALRHARELHNKLAVIMVDIDDFKQINDSLGHTVGDLLLQQAAVRIKKCVRENDTVARQGSDDFIVLLENLIDPQIAANTAARIAENFRSPFVIDGQQFFITISAGVAIAPEDGDNEDVLISNADLAMYRAKEKGKNTYCLFTNELNERIKHKLDLSTQLRNALENDEFVVYYQPKVDIAKKCIVGVEALVRWEPEPGTIISPVEFIPFAEETGLILPLAQFVLITACRQTVTWQSQGFSLNVSVNLSPKQFSQDDFVYSINTALLESGLSANMLELEITETLMMENEDLAIGLLWELKNMGIKISVDDFGTGYSSLAYLKQLPIDILKIDRSFVKDLPDNQDDVVLASTIINMAQSLGLNVVAEGVETVEQLRFMCEHGCLLIQGFLFSPPVSACKMTQLLEMTTDKIFEGFYC